MLKKKLFNTVSSVLRFHHTAHVAVNKTVRTVGNGVTLSLSCDKGTYSNWRVNMKQKIAEFMLTSKLSVYNYR